MTSPKTFLAQIFGRFASPPRESPDDSLHAIKMQIEGCESFIDKTVKLVNEWRQQSLKTEDALRDLAARMSAIEGRSSQVSPDGKNADIYLAAIFRGLLNRDCDEGARKLFGSQLAQGRPLQEIIDELMASDEYKPLKAKTPQA